jgi:hypothetical protein
MERLERKHFSVRSLLNGASSGLQRFVHRVDPYSLIDGVEPTIKSNVFVHHVVTSMGRFLRTQTSLSFSC